MFHFLSFSKMSWFSDAWQSIKSAAESLVEEVKSDVSVVYGETKEMVSNQQDGKFVSCFLIFSSHIKCYR